MAQKINGTQVSLGKTVDSNGWSVAYVESGKRVWTKSGTISGISLGAGLSFTNGTITSMPTGLTATDLHSSSYILTDSLVLDSSSRHIIPHTIFSTGSGTSISYGLVNTYTGGSWSGSMGYNYRIEEV